MALLDFVQGAGIDVFSHLFFYLHAGPLTTHFDVTSPICVLCDTGQDMTAAHLDECSALNDLNCIVKRFCCPRENVVVERVVSIVNDNWTCFAVAMNEVIYILEESYGQTCSRGYTMKGLANINHVGSRHLSFVLLGSRMDSYSNEEFVDMLVVYGAVDCNGHAT
ncbi:hypothetical protein TNCV_3373821 [Trichonephila clavipes]|nr:hypothetical protein TNCV_3373821 [Trichonephila clavipes]